MALKFLRNQFAARTFANLAAIIAVSTIFGAKAVELERRAALSAPAATTAASPGAAR